MGNSISKKKVKASLTTSHSPSKVKAFWKFGHVDKFKSVGQKQDEQRKLTVHYTASQHYQENVFIEGSRPKYLQDLHTEAQEGLKIQQQEELNNGMDFQETLTNSTVMPQDETDGSGQERDGCLGFHSTADHSVSSVSPGSALSSRPVLTRQGSTFKPLNTVKRPEKIKKRSRRTTIMGIPQHVQKELGMEKGILLQQLPAAEDSTGKVVIPTIDGEMPITTHEGARVHLQDIEALQASRDEQLLIHHLQAVYRDDLLLTCRHGPRILPAQRPKSLAVPGMTTSSSFLQEPQGPVMSISPQATYLSTIIPNAVLPAAIDVIEIDRSRSRQSMRTVSKSSLASASPGSSRSGINDDPTYSSSKQNHSKSSGTVVSNCSTISGKGNEPSQISDTIRNLNNEEQMSLTSSASCLSSTSKALSDRLEQGDMSDTGESTRNSQMFSRNLSVVKAKLPPTPPRRTYSLHHEKLHKRSKELLDTKPLNDVESNVAKEHASLSNKETMPAHSPVSSFLDDSHSSVTSSPHSPDQHSSDTQRSNSHPQNHFERTMSPSSGYSSQSGTPTHSSKDICPTSPGKHKVKPPKPERMGARTSPVVSVSSSTASLSSAASDPIYQSIQPHTSQTQPTNLSSEVSIVKNKVTVTPSATALRELFNIPPPPRVKAPCPPPPETWAHNKRTFELLCGPSPNPQRLYELQKSESLLINHQNTTVHSHYNPSESQIPVENKTTSREYNANRPQTEDAGVVFEAKDECVQVQEQVIYAETLRNAESPQSLEKVEQRGKERENVSVIIKNQEQNKLEDFKMEQKSQLSKKEHLKHKADERVTSDLLENDTSTPQTERTDIKGPCLTDKEILNHAPTKTLCVQSPMVYVLSPPPSPPPEHHPPTPPSKSCPVSLVSSSPLEKEIQPKTEEKLPILQSSWPPPPPPLEESSDTVFEGQDEIDFPPPPPPMQESLSDICENSNVESTPQGDNLAPGASFDVSDTPSLLQQNSESQIILSTKIPGKSLNEPPASNENTSQAMAGAPATSSEVPCAPSSQAEDQPTVNLKRQPSLSSKDKDSRSKELLSRNKNVPTPKEDANIPLVTPSLLQMVRLRSVTVEDQVNIPSPDGNVGIGDTPDQDQCISSQLVPQKPVRKACLKSTQPSAVSHPAAVPGPSMRLQEAIRMKTAAMSLSGVSARPSLRLPTPSTNSNDMTASSPNTLEGCDILKSPASTASFIFSKSTKKVVIETPTSPEAQASLKQNLAAEIMQITGPAKSIVTNGTTKQVKVPPPVAKKPVNTTNLSEKVTPTTMVITESFSSKGKNGLENDGQTSAVEFVDQQAQSPGNQMLASNPETVSTLVAS